MLVVVGGGVDKRKKGSNLPGDSSTTGPDGRANSARKHCQKEEERTEIECPRRKDVVGGEPRGSIGAQGILCLTEEVVNSCFCSSDSRDDGKQPR